MNEDEPEKETELGTRASLRRIRPYNYVDCEFCRDPIRFAARAGNFVVCNVYEDGKWDRIVSFHSTCYDEADRPHGEIVSVSPEIERGRRRTQEEK